MKRFLILLLLLLSLPAHAWGATYYVSSAGSNTSPYDTWAKAATTIQAAIEVATTAGSVIEIEQGTYNENIASRAVSVTIKASTEAGRGGVVTIAPASATHVVVLQHNNLTVNGITVQGSTGSNYNVRIAGSATGIVMNDCIIQSGTRALTTVSASATLNRCSVINHTDATVGIIVNGAPGLTLNYCKVINNAGYFRYTAGGGGACNNCLIMGTPSSVALFNDSTGTVVLNNTVVIANAYGSATLHVISNTSSGSITANNCLLLPNPLAPDTYGFNGLTDGGGNIYASPKFRTTRYPAIAVLGTDDYTNIGEWLQIAALSETRGVRATLALDTRSVSSANWSTLASYVARGHAVVSHTRDHGNLTKLNGLTIRYTGNGISATLAINVSTHSITTAITGQSDGSSNLSVDISNASFDELDEIAAYINAQTGYTCTVTDAENNNVNPVCFADVATQDIKTANYAALLDQTRYFTHQIDGSKSDIESGIPGYSCETMVYPYNEYSADIISAVQTAGYLGARGGGVTQTALTSIPVYSIYGIAPSDYMGVTNTPRNSAAYGNFMSFAGRVVFFVGHSLATFPLENWAQLIDALQASGVQIMTLPEAVKHVRNSGLWATADSGKTWTRTLSDASDYRLKPGSPCRNAGVSVGLVSDFAGKMIRGNPDIGAYEYFNPAGGGGFGDFNFSLGW